jgi:hypothetical protein
MAPPAAIDWSTAATIGVAKNDILVPQVRIFLDQRLHLYEIHIKLIGVDFLFI